MTKIKTLGLALVAVFAVSVVAVASASAVLPKFNPASGSFTGASATGVKPILETVKVGSEEPKIVECTGDTSSGTITGEQTVAEIKVIFKGCKGPGSTTCTTAGKSSGEIEPKTAEGKLGYVVGEAEGAKKVGLLITPVEPFAVFKCTLLGLGPTLKVTGSVICQLTPVNSEPTKTFVLTCNQTEGVQEFTKFEGVEATHILETVGEGTGGFTKRQSAEQTKENLTLTEGKTGKIEA